MVTGFEMDNQHIMKELVRAVNRLAQAIEKSNIVEAVDEMDDRSYVDPDHTGRIQK